MLCVGGVLLFVWLWVLFDWFKNLLGLLFVVWVLGFVLLCVWFEILLFVVLFFDDCFGGCGLVVCFVCGF